MYKIQYCLFVTILIVNYVNGSYCNCGLGPGEDMCPASSSYKKNCAPLVVRPVDVPKPPALPVPKVVCAPVSEAILPLVPQGGPCTCTKAIVKPAIVPRPVCNTCYKKSYNGCQQTKEECSVNEGFFNSKSSSPTIVDQLSAYYVPNSSPVASPADPVSLAIAYKMAQKSCHNIQNEDRLSFGFRKLPKELPPVVKKTNNIPEENLYSLNGQIVELKPVKQCTTDLDEEAADELLALSEETAEPVEVRKVSLGELGYGPAKQPAGAFINVPSSLPIELPKPKPCTDGYLPGAVVFKTVPRPQSLQFPTPVPCEEVPVVPDAPEPQVIPTCNCGGYDSGYFKSSSKSSSYKTNTNENVFFQKLGCY